MSGSKKTKKSSEPKRLDVNYDLLKKAAEEKLKGSINELEEKVRLGVISQFFRAVVRYGAARDECERYNNGLYTFNGDMDALHRGNSYTKRIEKVMQEFGGKHWRY